MLELFDASEPSETAGFRRILVTERDPPLRRPPGGRPATVSATSTASPTRWSTWSGPIADGTDPSPSFADGLQVQRVLAAVETSSDTRTWQEIPA